MDFKSQYTIVEEKYAQQFGIYNNVCRIASTNHQNQELVCIRITKQFIDEQVLFKYSSLKYFNILQPKEYFCTQDEHIFIYQNLYENLLNEQKLKSIIQQEGYKILLQLVLTFAEFQRRQFYWPLNSINQIYYNEVIIYLSLLEYDFTKFNQPQNHLDNFWSLINQYFIQLFQFQDMIQLKKEQNFNNILDYLFVKNQNIHQQSMLDPNYEKVLQYLLKINKFEQLYKGNCIVKYFQNNQIFSIYPELTDNIVYKQTQIYGDEEAKSNKLMQIQRDIELMEKFSNNENVAACFTYLRIKEYAFLLFRKFVGTLADRFKTWPEKEQNEEQIRKDVYVIASRTAESYMILYEKQILHRDLKPENILIDNNKLSESYSYVADFDCSKQIQGDINVTQTKVDSTYTPSYDPPETIQTFKYDIFQLGLIFLTLANKGKYIGDYNRGPRNLKNNEFDQYYSQQAIQRSLQSLNYDIQFINIIAQCLLKDPNQRPDIMTLCDKLKLFKGQSKFKITSSPVTQQNNNNPNITSSPVIQQNDNNPNITSFNVINQNDNNPNITSFNVINQNGNNSKITSLNVIQQNDNNPKITSLNVINQNDNNPKITSSLNLIQKQVQNNQPQEKKLYFRILTQDFQTNDNTSNNPDQFNLQSSPQIIRQKSIRIISSNQNNNPIQAQQFIQEQQWNINPPINFPQSIQEQNQFQPFSQTSYHSQNQNQFQSNNQKIKFLTNQQRFS